MNKKFRITNIRFDSDGVFVSILCGFCESVFERYLITVGGLALGQYVCPSCQFQHRIWPEDMIDVLDHMLPALSLEEQINLTDEATRITESWYQVPRMNALLTFQGVNLGEGPERELMSIVLQGLFQAREQTIRETKS